MRHPLLAASWRPTSTTQGDVIGLQLGLAVAAAVRAADYASSVDGTVGAIETALPLDVWAVLCLTIAGLLFVGVSARVHRFVWAGHMLGFITYSALALGLVINAFDGWPPDHYVAAVPFGTWVALCAALAAPPIVGVVLRWRVPAWRRLSARTAALAAVAAAALVALWALPADGLRGILPISLMAWLHLLLGWRTGWTPLRDGEATTVEETVAAPQET